MISLVIDTSSAAVTAGVVEIGPARSADSAPAVSVLAERVKVDARAHGELLAPFIAQAVAGAGLRMRDLAAVIAGVGPGPFTGLRVGLVTAAAISDALGIPAYPVCSLDAIATLAHSAAYAATPASDPLLVATDARRREVYWATYRGGRRQNGPSVSKPAAVAAELGQDGAPEVRAMAGAGARLYAEVLGFPVLDLDFPTVLGLAQVVGSDVLAASTPAPLTPLYLRRPDAVAATSSKAVSQP